jgi:hypothetical protein
MQRFTTWRREFPRPAARLTAIVRGQGTENRLKLLSFKISTPRFVGKHDQGVKNMFASLAILLVLAGRLAIFAFHVTAFFVHMVLVLAVALFVVQLVTRRNQSA